jgi:hypothetical protein
MTSPFGEHFESALAFATAFRHADPESMAEIMATSDPITLAASLAQMVWIATYATAIVLKIDADDVWSRFALVTNIIYGTNGEPDDAA